MLVRSAILLLAGLWFANAAAPLAVAQQPAAPPAKDAGPFVHQRVETAWETAKRSRRPMLLYVTSDQCVYCHKMVNETYAHPRLQPLLSQLFESVSMNVKQNPELVKKLGVRAYPTTLIISPDGSLLGKIEGFVAIDKIGAHLTPALAAHDRNQQVAAPASVPAR